MIPECSRADLRYVSSYFLSVSPAVVRLTVYRRLRYGPIREFGADFLKKLSFSYTNIHFLDFV